MAFQDETLCSLTKMGGLLAAVLGDIASGKVIASAGDLEDNLNVAIAASKAIIATRMRVTEVVGRNDDVEDVLITLGHQYHLVRPMQEIAGLFLYVVLDRTTADLRMARRAMEEFARESVTIQVSEVDPVV